jgi:hypothetical protein
MLLRDSLWERFGDLPRPEIDTSSFRGGAKRRARNDGDSENPASTLPKLKISSTLSVLLMDWARLAKA